jgi:hypothetical protein
MKELEIILGYIEEGKNKEKARELLRDDRWRVEKDKLERLLKLLKKDRGYDEECPDFEEAVRFYHGELPSDRRKAFIGHLIRCRGLCIDTLMSLRESEKRAAAFGERREGLLEELRDKGLISGGLLSYIVSEGERIERLRAYGFLQSYAAALTVLSVARAVRGRVLRAGGEDVRSVVKESDGFQVEVYPSPEAPGRLEAEISLKPGVEKANYEGVEMLVFVQAEDTMLSGIGLMKDGLASGLTLGGGRVGSGVFDDPGLIKIELYIGERV